MSPRLPLFFFLLLYCIHPDVFIKTTKYSGKAIDTMMALLLRFACSSWLGTQIFFIRVMMIVIVLSISISVVMNHHHWRLMVHCSPYIRRIRNVRSGRNNPESIDFFRISTTHWRYNVKLFSIVMLPILWWFEWPESKVCRSSHGGSDAGCDHVFVFGQHHCCRFQVDRYYIH